MKEKTYKEEDLLGLVRIIVSNLSKKIKKGKATFLFLEGDLGAGKTTFTKYLAKELGIREGITSPTFTIMHKYKIHTGSWENLFHIDAYRLKNKEELAILNLKNDFQNEKNLFIFEWPSNIKGAIDPDLEVYFSHVNKEGERKIHFKD